ncbi:MULTISPECIES: hypothetical protein [Sphingomonas]|jgi:hypothetical protein|uniref:hypothetical protein n=1 Tax=Sphingomonas TaxID=13687 RepID=UPI001AE594AC
MVSAAPPAEQVVSGDATIPVTIAGRALRLRIEPAAPGLPLLPRALTADLGLKGGGMFAFAVGYRIGSENFYGRTASVKFTWPGHKPASRRVGWLSRDYKPFADGTIGPGGVPEPVIRFQLHAARPGEVPLTVPLDVEGGLGGALFGDWFFLDGLVMIGGVPVKLRFDPHSPTTLVTAPAALALAQAQGGTMTYAAGQQEIAYGIVRPYRVMQLARPLMLGGIALSRVGVRVADADLAGRIPEEGAAAPAQDPDEIIVVAKAKRPHKGIIILGADALAGCSTLVFDKPAKQARLSCATGG